MRLRFAGASESWREARRQPSANPTSLSGRGKKEEGGLKRSTPPSFRVTSPGCECVVYTV